MVDFGRPKRIAQARTLLEQSCVHVSVPGSQELVEKIIPHFLYMIARPPSGAWKFGFPTPGDADTGLIYRDGKKSGTDGAVYDRKWFFHFRPEIWNLFESHDQDPGEFRTMIEWCEALYRLCRETMASAMKTVTDEYPKMVVPPFCTNKTEHLDVLRLLAYTETRSEIDPIDGATNVTAQGHRDRSGATLAIAESHPGLEGARGECRSKGQLKLYEPYRPVASKKDRPLLFVSAKLQDMNGGGGTLPALVHRVRQVVPDRVNPQVIRWSVVFFGQAEGTEHLQPATH